MFYLLLVYLVISAICSWVGWLFYQVLPVSFTAPNGDRSLFPDRPGIQTPSGPYTRPLILYLLTGLILLTGIGQWWVLIHPINNSTITGIVGALGVFTWLRRRHLPRPHSILPGTPGHRPLLFITCCAALFLMIIILNAGPSMMDDTDSYHIQMIKWIREYGTVPGIANLHLRFGFNSSWFTTIALLLPPAHGINPYMALNGLISCWLCHYLLFKIFTAITEGASTPHSTSPYAGTPTNASPYASFLILAICLLAWPMIRGNAASANYDFISTCCIIVLFMETASPSRPGLLPEWLIWPCYLFTVRMINGPLLLVPLILLIRNYRTSTLMACITTASFFIIPFFIRNVILSGYLLFPAAQIDLFSPDWKAGKEWLVQITEYIKYYNRSNGNPEQVVQMPFTGWIRVWYHHLFLYDKILIDLAILSWALLAIRWKRITAKLSPTYKAFLLTVILMAGAWLFTAPDPRFIYGILLAGVFTIVHTLPTGFLPLITSRRPLAIICVLLSTSLFAYSATKLITHPEYQNWLLTRPLPVPAARTLKVDGIDMQIPDKVLDNWNPRCYDLELPCLYQLNPRLHARGKYISDGFRVDKAEPSEHPEGEYKIK